MYKGVCVSTVGVFVYRGFYFGLYEENQGESEVATLQRLSETHDILRRLHRSEARERG